MTYYTWQQILGVSEDADLKACKRAYSKLIKGIDQETEQEEFMRVRQAYDTAVAFFEESVPIFDYNRVDESDDKADGFDAGVAVVVGSCDSINLLMEHYMDFDNRFRVDAWEAFFNSLTLQEELMVNNSMPTFLNYHFNLSEEIWHYLQHKYALTQSPHFCQSNLVDHNPQFDYQQYGICDGDEREAYYTFRHDLYKGLLQSKGPTNIANVHSEVMRFKPVLEQDGFAYTLILKFALKTNDNSLFEILSPDKLTSQELVAEYLRYHGYFALNQKQDFIALKSLRTAAEINGAEPLINLGLAKVFWRLGYKKSAKYHVRRAERDTREGTLFGDFAFYGKWRVGLTHIVCITKLEFWEKADRHLYALLFLGALYSFVLLNIDFAMGLTLLFILSVPIAVIVVIKPLLDKAGRSSEEKLIDDK